MTIKDLIDHLKTLDQNTEIKVYAEGGYEGGWGYEDIINIKKEKDANGAYVIYW